MRKKIVISFLALFLFFLFTSAVSAASGDFARGVNYVSWWYNQYESTASDSSIQAIKDNTNSSWVSILVTQYLDDLSDTSIAPISEKTPSDTGLIRAIKKAHALNMKVSLKPHVDVGYDSSTDRGSISYSNETDWQNWFGSYKTFINHYAELAQANGVEMLVIGTELKGTSQRESDWRSIIAGVKARYSGKIVYAANYDEYQNIGWWDAVDYIGIDAYFPLTSKTNPTVQEMQDAFAQHIATAQTFAAQFGKKIMITEIGFQSRDGTNITPWWSNGSLDLQEQADAYNATLEVMKNNPIITGAFWWNWLTTTNQGGNTDTDFTPHGKPAEKILSQYYSGSFAIENIACNNNSDCGPDGWTGATSCSGNDVYQNYKTYACNNPGTIQAACTSNSVTQLKQTCSNGCSNGSCKSDCQYSVPFYRFWNNKNGEHFYTASESEKTKLLNNSRWAYEGITGYLFTTQKTNTSPIYRFWNTKTAEHFYTLSDAEKTKLITKYPSWTYEGTAGYMYQNQATNTIPLYRFYNSKTSQHFFTASESEKTKLTTKYADWIYEGISGYICKIQTG